MATTVQLKRKDDQGNVKIENFEIDEIVLDQYIEMMKVVNGILAELKGNESLLELLDFIGQGENQEEDENGNKISKELDDSFVLAVVNSFESLTIKMPEHAIQLVSTLSGISVDILKKQKMAVVMDIYDAIIQENDIEKLLNRVKKSLALTKAKVNLKAIVNKMNPKSQTSA